MSPRTGGEAGKLGDDYELVWAAWHALLTLAGECQAITLEAHEPLGKGVDLVIERESIEAHQLKRQHGRSANWTLTALEARGVLRAAAAQVAAGRRFQFISTVPAIELSRLSEAAAKTDSFDQFINLLSSEDRPTFDALGATCGWPQGAGAWETLKRIEVHWPDHRLLEDQNAVLAELLLEGAGGHAASAALGKLVLGAMGRRLDAAAIEERLPRFKLRRLAPGPAAGLAETIRAETSRWRERVESAMVRPAISRPEVDQLHQRLLGPQSAWLAVGQAGAGKSVVLAQLTDQLAGEGWPVLALRLDRVGQVRTAQQLGAVIDLPLSPVAALASVADGGPCLLLLDQLDVVSVSSGRDVKLLDVVAELLRQARAFPAMRVVMACRRFDVDSDERLGALTGPDGPASEFAIGSLSLEQVAAAVDALGLPSAALNAAQRELLRLPINLVLLAAVADDRQALDFTTTSELLGAFWRRKQRDCNARAGRPVRFDAVLRRLAQRMSTRGKLSASVAVLDEDDLMADAEVLATENVISLQAGRAAFFHETFFDYVFARQWVQADDDLVRFLRSGEQELFRRSQLRQILLYLHDEEPDRFVAQFEALMRDEHVRFHLKDVAVRTLELIREPASADLALVERLGDQREIAGRLWGPLRTAGWLERLDRDGKFEAWISAPDGRLREGAWALLSAASERDPDAVAKLLDGWRSSEDYPARLRHVALSTKLSASRALFELVVEGVRDGHFSASQRTLWQAAEGLADAQPQWAAELLAAWVLERPDAADLVDGSLPWLEGRDDRLAQMAATAARAAPLVYCERLLGWYAAVMAATAVETQAPIKDAHFSARRYTRRDDDNGAALIAAAGDAVRALAKQHPERLADLVEQLAPLPYDAANWLLAEALRSAPPSIGGTAARLLIEAPWRLACGYVDHPYWASYQLLEAVSPHVSDEEMHGLECLVLSYRSPTESDRPGLARFTLLAGLDESRLSPAAGAEFAGLREQFGPEPLEPVGVRAEFVASPVPQETARDLDDAGWLDALAENNDRKRDPARPFVGGAEQLANVLEQITSEQPTRFARLALRFDADLGPAFLAAVLRGVGKTKAAVDRNAVFELIRHARRDAREEIERWMASPLPAVLDGPVPEDVIATLLDRALHAAAPRPGDGPTVVNWTPDDERENNRLLTEGLNTTRGSLAIALGNLLVHDGDGTRAELLAPSFSALAADRSSSVRACVAHLLRAGLRHAEKAVIAAFPTLVEDREVLTCGMVENLIAALCSRRLGVVEPVLLRMAGDDRRLVRRAAGRLLAYAGLELARPDLLTTATRARDPELRRGAAFVCAHRLPFTRDTSAATDVVRAALCDPDPGVRSAAATLVDALRGHPLRPHTELLELAVHQRDVDSALSGLLLTLEAATEYVGDLIVTATKELVARHGQELSDFSRAAAADARHASELIIRAYASARTRTERAVALDQIDDLLRRRAYGIDRELETVVR